MNLRASAVGSGKFADAHIQQVHARCRPALTPEMHPRLVTVYRDDILRLQNMIGRELSARLRP